MRRLIQFLIFVFCLFLLTSHANPLSKDDLGKTDEYQIFAASGSCYYKDVFGQFQKIRSISTILTGETWIVLGEDAGVGVNDLGTRGAILILYKDTQILLQNDYDPQTKKNYKIEGPLYDLLYQKLK